MATLTPPQTSGLVVRACYDAKRLDPGIDQIALDSAKEIVEELFAKCDWTSVQNVNRLVDEAARLIVERASNPAAQSDADLGGKVEEPEDDPKPKRGRPKKQKTTAVDDTVVIE